MKKLDPYTFGNSKAAVTLAKILSDSPLQEVSRVAGVFQDFSSGVNNIVLMPHFKEKEYVLNVWEEHFRCIIDNSSFSDQIKSFLTNLVVAKHRRAGKSIRENTLRIKKIKMEKKMDSNNSIPTTDKSVIIATLSVNALKTMTDSLIEMKDLGMSEKEMINKCVFPILFETARRFKDLEEGKEVETGNFIFFVGK